MISPDRRHVRSALSNATSILPWCGERARLVLSHKTGTSLAVYELRPLVCSIALRFPKLRHVCYI